MRLLRRAFRLVIAVRVIAVRVWPVRVWPVRVWPVRVWAVRVWVGLVLAGLVLAGNIAVPGGLLSASLAQASPSPGWVRLAHLSPNAPPMDVYLYSFGDPRARVVLRRVAYGMVSPYEEVPQGDYIVSMRAAGAGPTTQPALSAGFWVNAGDAYTVAGTGPHARLRVQVLKDRTAAPAGRVLVRVIQASLRQPEVTVTLGGLALARKLQFTAATSYHAVAPGIQLVRAAGTSVAAATDISLPADSIHTLVVLDHGGGLRVADLTDAAGSQVPPSGGAATGLGGTAPRPSPSPLPSLAVIAVGILLAGAGLRRYRRIRLAGTRTH
jgi:Domain of unknown function (DUF4397)